MKNETQGQLRLSTDNPTPSREPRPETPRVLTPGEWARVVLGVKAPFGQDRQPTVFG